MKPTVYVETTIVSYLVGWLSRNDLQVAANQELTRRWWADRRYDFELFASTVVVDEASDGDPGLAAERLRFLKDVTLLRVPDHAHTLKLELLRRTHIPAKAENDALHIAVAAVHGMEFLVTWNCKHIANAVVLQALNEVLSDGRAGGGGGFVTRHVSIADCGFRIADCGLAGRGRGIIGGCRRRSDGKKKANLATAQKQQTPATDEYRCARQHDQAAKRVRSVGHAAVLGIVAEQKRAQGQH